MVGNFETLTIVFVFLHCLDKCCFENNSLCVKVSVRFHVSRQPQSVSSQILHWCVCMIRGESLFPPSKAFTDFMPRALQEILTLQRVALIFPPLDGWSTFQRVFLHHTYVFLKNDLTEHDSRFTVIMHLSGRYQLFLKESSHISIW